MLKICKLFIPVITAFLFCLSISTCASSKGTLFERIAKQEKIKPSPKEEDKEETVKDKDEDDSRQDSDTGEHPSLADLLNITPKIGVPHKVYPNSEKGIFALESSPAEASVFIDGRYRGLTPLTVTDFNRGHHSVKITKQGYKTVTEELEFEGGEKRFTYYLSEERIFLIDSNPAHAKVFLNGIYKGITPLELVNLQYAEYGIRIENEGFNTIEESVIYEMGVTHKYFELDINGFYITTAPAEADIFINEQRVGKSPFIFKAPPPGDYTIRAEYPGYASAEIKQSYTGTGKKVNFELNPGNLVRITSGQADTEVFLNDEYKGFAPLELPELESGTYVLHLQKPGFSPIEYTLKHDGTFKELNFDLVLIQGKLSVTVNPRDVRVYLNDSEISPGVHELPAGSYILTADEFGYERYFREIKIKEGQSTQVNVNLQAAGFRVDNVKFSQSVLDLNSLFESDFLVLSFEVTTRGKAYLKVKNGAGKVVYRDEIKNFPEKSQAFYWYGQTSDNELVPDGEYTVTLEVKNEADNNVFQKEKTVTVDRTKSVTQKTLFNGVGGLLYTGTPYVLAAGDTQISMIFLTHVEETEGGGFSLLRSPATLGVSYGLLPRLELDMLAGIIMERSSAQPVYLSGAVSYQYLHILGEVDFTSAVSVKLSYHTNTATDSLTNFSGLSLGLPLALRVGLIHFIANPEIKFSPWKISYRADASDYDKNSGFYTWLYLRFGILLDLNIIKAGASLALHTKPLEDGFAFDTPLQAGFELTCDLGNGASSSAYAACEFESITSYYWMFGGGMQITF